MQGGGESADRHAPQHTEMAAQDTAHRDGATQHTAMAAQEEAAAPAAGEHELPVLDAEAEALLAEARKEQVFFFFLLLSSPELSDTKVYER